MNALAAVTLALGIIALLMGGAFCFAAVVQVSERDQEEVSAAEKRAAVVWTSVAMVLLWLPFGDLIASMLAIPGSILGARECYEKSKKSWAENSLVRRFFKTGGWCLIVGSGLLLWSAASW